MYGCGTHARDPAKMRDHVILGPQPVIDAGSGRCFWRASTHPDPEMAKTGKRQRQGGGGGEGGSSKNAEGSSRQKRVGGGAGAGLELPGLNVSLLQHMRDVDCLVGDITRESKKQTMCSWCEKYDDLINRALSCRRDARVGRQVGLEAARRQGRRRQKESTG